MMKRDGLSKGWAVSFFVKIYTAVLKMWYDLGRFCKTGGYLQVAENWSCSRQRRSR